MEVVRSLLVAAELLRAAGLHAGSVEQVVHEALGCKLLQTVLQQGLDEPVQAAVQPKPAAKV